MVEVSRWKKEKVHQNHIKLIWSIYTAQAVTRSRQGRGESFSFDEKSEPKTRKEREEQDSWERVTISIHPLLLSPVLYR